MVERPDPHSDSGTWLDPWHGAYAARAHGLRSSEIRALFAVVSRPEVVSLAGGMPNIKDLPLDSLAESARTLISRHGAQAMQYGSGQGWEDLRQRITEVMTYDGINADPDDVVVTTGSQQALDLVSEIFLEKGDVVLAEAPSYVGALGTFRAYEGEVVHVDMDEDGLIPEALEEMIRRLRAQGRRIKFLYTIPNFHNPAGVTLSEQRRPVIVEICRREHILIVEDNPYGLLGFDSDPLPALQSYNPEGVVYLGSFSKMFAPGFRIGWALAPHAIRNKLVLASESAILSPSMVGQMAIEQYLSDYDWYGQVKVYRQMYRDRCNAMMTALQDFLPDLQWTTPKGGFYTWVTLPEGLDAKAMLPRAVTGLVAYVSGTAFYADGRGGDHMRLSFCYPPPEEIREGVSRLSRVINAERELVEMFGTNDRAELPDDAVSAPAPDQV
ncbi:MULTISPECIES: PLP-dependent aminotransferase family protein [Actinomycetaceae]|uniref:aminotransferase-like domain-containing protein n=1 Tax=Actinomycetaceae TaxID=2049 RepID=UPI0008A3075C|nr:MULTISPECIES: PLP-dependent aminotransferase family protein [Actinomycetaceae]MBS5826726.1 PLP-dependent aminotransferase family protein [Actinomyces sp.]MBS6101572.1 PLP-dependent aminotransferase family protein [Actinomyces sp.]MDK7143083.1 PLP-dependent aminotransferase family protein [Gleimia europaea]MDP9833635.1 DNA-binding transcriptional MocR family regulator [Gleimia europaea]MDU4287389.1 PLP-dependent aminotransferase family protein [Actinomyces sp.]